jgi:hypothetical protein
VPRLRLFDLLDVTTAAAAAARWPRDRIGAATGEDHGDDDVVFEALLAELDSALELHAFRPGAAYDRVGFTAQLDVLAPTIHPLVAATMPDVGVFLEPTLHQPAHLFVTHGPDAAGLEVVIHGLPVKLALPLGLLAPGAAADPDGAGVIPVRLTAPFDPDAADSLEITVSNVEPSTIRVRVNVRFTRSGDVLLQPVVPISIGPCRFLGLPCRGLHDVHLFPTLRPAHVPAAEARSELPLTWLRYPVEEVIGALAYPSAIAVRNVELDPDWSAYQGLQQRLLERRVEQTGGEVPGDIEMTPLDLVIEDIVLPLGLGLPLPLHGRFALRRRVLEADAGDYYNLDATPGRFDLGDTQLVISRFLVQTQVEGGLPAAISTAWVRTDDELADLDELPAVLMSLTEEPAAETGIVFAEGHRRRLFQVGGATVRAAALRFGVLIDNLATSAAMDEFLFLVADLEVEIPTESDEPVALRKRGQPGNLLLRGLGWKDGKPVFGSLYDPDGLDLVILRGVKVTITEAGLVGAHGTRYLSVSGRYVTGESEGEDAHALSITLRRLRLRLSDAPAAPKLELDGIELAYKRGTTELLGFGMISDTTRDGTRFQEIGIEVKLAIDVLDGRFELGGQYLRGTARGAASFDYTLFGLQIGQIMLGSVTIVRAQVLWVRNLAPALPAPIGDEPALRLFKWFKAQGDALTVPLSRRLGSWEPRDRAFAVGLGLSLQLAGTTAMTFRAFLLYREDDVERGMLGGLELYLFKAEQPAVFLVYEHDFARDRMALTAGLDLSIDKLLGDALPDFLDVVHLSGSGFWSSTPDTLAIGQYPDPSTWLCFSLTWGETVDVRFAFCYHKVDAPDPADPNAEQINAIAFAASFKGSWKIGAVASEFQFYAALEIRSAQWRTAATDAATTVRGELAVRLKLFGWFRFGASVLGEWVWLGPEGNDYRRRSVVFRVETPWFLPDVTIRWEKTAGSSKPSDLLVLDRPVVAATALDVARRSTPIALATRLGLPEAKTYALAALRASAPAPAADADFAGLTPVATDAAIVLDLGGTVEATATIAPPAPAGASAQRCGELHTRHELTRIGIRRRARFGPDAGVWRDLIDPIATELPPLDQLPGDLTALFTSAVTLAWDGDATRLDRLDARRLIVNGDTPYTLTVGNPANDEDLAGAHPRWPCCLGAGDKPVWHRLDFTATPVGARVPRLAWFSASRSTLRWTGIPPAVIPATAMSGAPAAAIVLGPLTARTVATVHFDRPAHTFELTAAWPAQHSHARLRIDAYRGIKRVATVELATHDARPGTPPVVVVDAGGVTHLRIRKAGEAEPMSELGSIAPVLAMRYCTVAEVRAELVAAARCAAADAQLHTGGALAWLPNHDYEITLRTRIELEYEAAGAQDGEVDELARFRTKGAPGLNATAAVGEELAPYVESIYPRPGLRLYRDEPIVVAFDDRWSRYALVDRVVAPADPAERQQILEWALAIDHHTGGVPRPLTATAQDWIVAHRGAPVPPDAPWWEGLLVYGARRVSSLDPARLRLETMARRPGACGQPLEPRPSRVLIHAPVPDPSGAPAWAADAAFEVNLRAHGAPWVQRRPLEPADATALTFAAIAGAAVEWTFTDGALRPGAGAGAAVQLAELGDATWDHVTAAVGLTAGEGTAGVALGVDGAPAVDRAVYAVIERGATVASLRLVERRGGVDHVLGAAAVPVDAGELVLTAFDDRWRARVGDVVLEAARDGVRAGRAALVATAPGGITGIEIHALDAYRVAVATSRWRTFAAHVGSFGGRPATWDPAELGGAPSTVAALLAATGGEVTQAMAAGGDPEARDRLFDRWLEQLALPVRGRVERVEITRYVIGDATHAFLIESPEPLPIGDDVTAALRHEVDAPWPWPPPILHRWPWPQRRPLHRFPSVPLHLTQAVAHVALRSGDQTRVLVVPVDAAGAALATTGAMTIELALARTRYRGTDAAAVYAETATVQVP